MTFRKIYIVVWTCINSLDHLPNVFVDQNPKCFRNIINRSSSNKAQCACQSGTVVNWTISLGSIKGPLFHVGFYLTEELVKAIHFKAKNFLKKLDPYLHKYD